MIVFSQRIAKRQLDIQQVTNLKRCFIIQQRTARTSVYTMILTYLHILFVPWMTHEAVQLKTPLTTVAGNNLCPSPTLQCHPSFSFPFHCAPSGALWPFSPFFPQYLIPNQSFDVRTVIPLIRRQGLSIFPTPSFGCS